MNELLPLDALDQAKKLMLEAKRIVILSHKNPDADSVGANLALREALETLGKEVSSACVDPVPENCRFLRMADTLLRDFDPSQFDIVITVDCGSHKLMAFHEKKPELLDRRSVQLINIDHHPTNDHFGNVNLVLSQTPATCFILFLAFIYFGWTVTPTMATALLHGLYYDTGSFMHSNTSPEALRVAARLKALGADHSRLIKEQFHSSSISKLHLWGRALSRAMMSEKRTVVTAVTKHDYEEEMATADDLSGLVNYLNHVPEARFCVLLSEENEGKIKASLRTQDEALDLSAITSLFGGGGHKKAAGFTVSGCLKEKRMWMVG